MPSRSIRRMLRCGECFRLWCFLDESQRERNAPVRGSRAVEHELGWQPRTAQKHLRHLADVGLVRLDPEPAYGGGWSDTRFVVAHSPARGRHGTPRELDGVWEKPKPRWRNPSNLAHLTNARRDAPSVDDSGPGPAEETALSERSARRATKQGASRYQTRRDATSVRAIPISSDSLGVARTSPECQEGGQAKQASQADHHHGQALTDPPRDHFPPADVTSPRDVTKRAARRAPSGLEPRDAVIPTNGNLAHSYEPYQYNPTDAEPF
ncbi:MAG: hypothetical protein M0Z30_14915 [Actinomycetota bacterium]|nr:hypothetical protein [Actinomycetota bacterium]